MIELHETRTQAAMFTGTLPFFEEVKPQLFENGQKTVDFFEFFFLLSQKLVW